MRKFSNFFFSAVFLIFAIAAIGNLEASAGEKQFFNGIADS